MLIIYKIQLYDLGIELCECKTNDDYLTVVLSAVPQFIFRKMKMANSEQEFKIFFYNLVVQCLNDQQFMYSMNSNQKSIFALPSNIIDFFNSDACHGAIKFGDKLTSNECSIILQQLSKCYLPFQCAHGRPTVVPIINLKRSNVRLFSYF
jgi:DNA mismatch repair ATPase MutL